MYWKITMKYLALILLCLSCKQSNDVKQTLQAPLRDNIDTIDPANAYDSISLSVVYQAYEQLYEYHYQKRPYSLQPLLAVGLPRIEQNGTRYTIKIKSGILYHDDPAFKGRTRHVKAIDFINQIKRIATGQNQEQWMVPL